MAHSNFVTRRSGAQAAAIEEVPKEAPTSTPEALAAAVKQGVYEGRFVPGQRLVESDLVATLSAGRGSIREALRLLAAQGVVEFELHRGARVRQYSRPETLSLLQIREVLEGLAAALAASGRTAADLKRLQGIQAQAGRAIAGRRIDAFLACNEALHDVILDASGNPNIRLHIAQAQLSYFRLQTRLFGTDDLARSHAEHGEIVRTVGARDAPAAEAAMRRHVRSSRDVVMRAPDSFFRASSA
jgi:DNA-binding GntR family transcriptional regulator